MINFHHTLKISFSLSLIRVNCFDLIKRFVFFSKLFRVHIDKVLMKYWVIEKTDSKWNYESLWTILDGEKISHDLFRHITYSICNKQSLGSNRFTLQLWTIFMNQTQHHKWLKTLSIWLYRLESIIKRPELLSKSNRPLIFSVTNRITYMSGYIMWNFIAVWDCPKTLLISFRNRF